ncbi:hypothetical protein GGQ99_000985 [Aminobacter niigataensis]|uniref:Uncharacterized protein n=1 Tax=Aminobacter niigataensis TaxID=83265 RepID=A0ABR6KXL1_9HYPH|nr:hypothetical protein [Aminobacter niigataensis]MBB4649263.1 hypothetical protein [Aminobacter niigataensis]
MESPIEHARAARFAAARVAEAMQDILRAEASALPVHWKLAAGHDALMSSVSHLAMNCHRTSTRLFTGAPFRVNRLRSLSGAHGAQRA